MYTELETTAMIRHPEARTLITEHTSTLAVLTESFVYISFLDFMRHVAWWLFQSRIPPLPHLKLNSPIISFVCNLFLSFLIVSKHLFASILLCYVKLLTTETDVMARLDFMRYTLMINFGQIFFIEISLCFLAATLRVFFTELEEGNELLNPEKIFTATSWVTAELTLHFCPTILLVKIS